MHMWSCLTDLVRDFPKRTQLANAQFLAIQHILQWLLNYYNKPIPMEKTYQPLANP